MKERQVEQGNKADIKKFQFNRNRSSDHGDLIGVKQKKGVIFGEA